MSYAEHNWPQGPFQPQPNVQGYPGGNGGQYQHQQGNLNQQYNGFQNGWGYNAQWSPQMQQWNQGYRNNGGIENGSNNGTYDPNYQRTLEYVQQCQTWSNNQPQQ